MSQEHVEIVRRALDAFNRRDRAAWLALCDPEIEWSPPREWPESNSVRDPEVIWAFMSELDAPWQRGDYMLSEVIEGDTGRVAGRIKRRVRGKTSGVEAEFEYWNVVTVRTGRMLRCDWFSDRAEALEAAGLSAQAMPQANVEIVRSLYSHWARGDFGFASVYEPEVEFARIGAEGGGIQGRWRGLEEFWPVVAEYLRAFSDLRTEVERMIDLGDDRVLVLSRQIGSGKLSRAPIEHQLGDLITLRDGRIVRCEFYWNRAEALEAAGLAEA